MKLSINRALLLLFWFCGIAHSQVNKSHFHQLYELLESGNFFLAKKLYDPLNQNISKNQQLYIEAIIDNSFNKIQNSVIKTHELDNAVNKLPDSLMFKLQDVKLDNAIKNYNYELAGKIAKNVLQDYPSFLDERKFKSYANNKIMWSALKEVQKQEIKIHDKSRLKMEKDKAGLNTLPVSIQNDSLDFIFDTGANLCTTTMDIAESLNMKIFPEKVKIGTITGEKVEAQMAVCESLFVGNNEFLNVVFIVLPAGALSFSEADYQIKGILGFPIFQALKKIKITRDGFFITSNYSEESKEIVESNMALDGLSPLVFFDEKHFTFDTGADHTILFKAFFEENRKEIEDNYSLEKITFWGAGGEKEYDGYRIDYSFMVGERELTLENIDLLIEKRKENEKVYGNIGQDLVNNFDAMIIDFQKMRLEFQDKNLGQK